MIQDTVRDRFDAVRGLSSEDILAALGLQRKRSALDVLLPAAGIFAAGLVLGTGAALLLAPKSGREIRSDIKHKASELTERIGATADDIAHEVRDSLAHKGEEAHRVLENGMPRAERKVGEVTPRAATLPKS